MICDRCWTSSFEPVETEAECDLTHPHEGEHMRCLCCALERRIVELRMESESRQSMIESLTTRIAELMRERDEARAEYDKAAHTALRGCALERRIVELRMESESRQSMIESLTTRIAELMRERRATRPTFVSRSWNRN